jgi:hypothetical protein
VIIVKGLFSFQMQIGVVVLSTWLCSKGSHQFAFERKIIT